MGFLEKNNFNNRLQKNGNPDKHILSASIENREGKINERTFVLNQNKTYLFFLSSDYFI